MTISVILHFSAVIRSSSPVLPFTVPAEALVMRTSPIRAAMTVGRRLLAAILLAAAALPYAALAQTDVHNTATGGNWTAAATWQGGVIPNNGTPPGSTYNAFIDAAGTYM